MSYSKFLCICLLWGPGLLVAAGDGTRPQHEEHGEYEPPAKGTTSALCESGVSGGFPCRNIELLARLPLEAVGGGKGADSWGWKDSQTGRYYALLARSNGTSFIDITEPTAPVYLGNLPSTSGDQPWRDVKVYADHAFIVADGIPGHGMQVFDLTRLRGLSAPQTFAADAHYAGVGPAHNLVIDTHSGLAAIVGSNQCSGGLHLVDIRTPRQPQFAGCFSADGYTHDAQCVNYIGPDTEHLGAQVCFAANEDSLTIADISDPSSPSQLGKALYPQTGFSHQGWLDPTQSLFFMGDETDELSYGMNTRTLIFDVRDLDKPVYLGDHIHATHAIDHNLYVKGDYLYQANYMSGVRILRIQRGSQVTLEEVAYFDTEPSGDALSFAGAWNVYPFFDTDVIIASDINNGLFVLRVDLGDGPVGAPIDGSISGAWVSDGLNDQGMVLVVGETANGPFVYFSWFLFLDGEPFWLSGAQSFEYGADEVVIPTERLSGLPFLVPDGSQAQRTDIGDTVLHVHGCDTLHVVYDYVGLGSGELVFTRLAGVEGRACSD